MSSRIAPLILALAACSAPADRASGAPAIVVRLTTDLPVPSAFDRLEIRVDAGGATSFERSYALPGEVGFPTTLTLAATSSHGSPPPGTLAPGIVPAGAEGDAIVLLVRASHAGVPVVARTVRFAMPSSQRALDVSLDLACVGTTCPDAQTCQRGACIATDVDAASLPGFGT